MGVNSPLTAGLLYRISGPFESTYGLAQYVIGTWLAFPSWSVKLWASTVPRPGKKGPASEASGHQVRSPKGKPPFEPFSGPRIPPPSPMSQCWLPDLFSRTILLGEDCPGSTPLFPRRVDRPWPQAGAFTHMCTSPSKCRVG